MADDDSTMVRNAGKLSVLTMISRILGLVREMTKAVFLGTGALSDAFTVSFTIPNFMRRLFAEGSISVAFIPTFKDYLHEGDDEATREFLSASLTVLVLCVGAVVAAGMAASPWIVRAFGTEPVETAILTRIMFPFLALVSLAALFQGILNSFGVFTPSGFAPIWFNLCFIIIPGLLGRFTANPARAMAAGVVAGGLAQALCQLPAVLRTGRRFGFISPRRAFANPGMKKVFNLIAPTILGMAAYQVNDLVSTAFASRAGEGVASSLQYSLRLQELILGVFAVSAGTVLLPSLADSVRKGEWERYSSNLGKGMRGILLATIPVAIFSMVAGREIVTLLFRKGGFGDESVRLTASAFLWHQTGLAFIAFNRVVAPAFYARSDSKTPTFAGIASFTVNVILVIFLAVPLQGPGIAGALSLSAAVNSLVLVAALLGARLPAIPHRPQVPGIRRELGSTAVYAGRLLAFSSMAALPALFLRTFLIRIFAGHGRLISSGMPLLLLSLVYAAIGIALLLLSKDPTARALGKALGRRFGRSRS
jgi:putative peptidoglycan lipid II flippase